jgi:hypothetical protein
MVHGMRVRPFCNVSRTYRSSTYLLLLFNVAQITAAFAFFIFLVRARAQDGRRPHFNLFLTVALLSSATRPSLDALSQVLLLYEQRLGVFVSFGWGPVWARLGGVLPIWFRETWMPRHVTQDAFNGDLATSCRPTEPMLS